MIGLIIYQRVFLYIYILYKRLISGNIFQLIIVGKFGEILIFWKTHLLKEEEFRALGIAILD